MESEPPSESARAADRISRMSAELRRFTEEHSRRNTGFDQQLASAHYRSVRTTLLLSVLTRARAGTLAADWRDTLALRPTEQPSAATYRAGDELAVREVTEIPPAAWEPHSGAGWRTALDAWFHATGDAYTILEEVWTEIQTANRERLLAERAAVQRLSRRLGWRQPPTVPDPPPISASPHTVHRFHIEAWYRAGLSGGGADASGGGGNDWLDWLRTHPSPDATTLLARVTDPTIRWQLEHLPAYWRTPAL